MLRVEQSKSYARDLRRMARRGKDLSGDWEGYRECHIESDWLLVYKIEEKKLILVLTRTGSHADIF